MNSKTLKLQSYTNKQTIEAASWIYDLALRGEISGICFTIKHNRFAHTVGIAGDYKIDPYCALRPAKRLQTLIKKTAKTLEEHAEIEVGM